MKLEKKVYPFLNDEKFDSGLRLRIGEMQKGLVDRITFIVESVKNKKVIHVGCLDHIPLIDEKIKKKVWLHKRIDEAALKQVGIDINEEGLKVVREKGFLNVYYENIVSNQPPGDFISSDSWDIMVLGEILEHVNNPVEFLQKLHTKYSDHVTEVLISVPNAFALENFLHVLKNKEFINSDHRAWFSIYTLAKNLTIAGFANIEFEFVTSYADDYKRNFIWRYFLNRFPALRSTIIMRASF